MAGQRRSPPYRLGPDSTGASVDLTRASEFTVTQIRSRLLTGAKTRGSYGADSCRRGFHTSAESRPCTPSTISRRKSFCSLGLKVVRLTRRQRSTDLFHGVFSGMWARAHATFHVTFSPLRRGAPCSNALARFNRCPRIRHRRVRHSLLVGGGGNGHRFAVRGAPTGGVRPPCRTVQHDGAGNDR